MASEHGRNHVLTLMVMLASLAYTTTLTECTLPTESCPGIGSGIARFINDSGLVAGDSGGTTDPQGDGVFIWDSEQGMRGVGPPRGQVVALNQAGQVLIKTIPSEIRSGCLLWDDTDGLRDVGTLGGRSSVPITLNDAGRVLGTSETADHHTCLFLWDAQNGIRKMDDFGVANFQERSLVVDMNNSGQLAGTIMTYQDQFGTWSVPHAFLWDPVDGFRDLGTLGGNSSAASDLNNAGQVVGWSLTADDTVHAFIWDAASGIVDLGDLGGSSSASDAAKLNDAGQVIGHARWYDPQVGECNRGFIWDPANGMRMLPTPGELHSFQVTDINEHGQVVGQGGVGNGGYDHAMRWDAKNGTQDLGPSCLWHHGLSWALDINNAGQIAGYLSGENHLVAFTW